MLRQDFATLRSEIATSFAAGLPNELDARIATALQRVGEFFALDRITIYALSSRGAAAAVANEWTRSGNPRRPAEVPVTPFNRAASVLLRGQPVVVPDIESLPEEWRGERDALAGMGVGSLVGLPAVVGGETVAALSLAQHRKREWSPDTVEQMLLLAEAFASVLARQRQGTR
jgi:GAF domain-containing protein